jgi:hypothetical protein
LKENYYGNKAVVICLVLYWNFAQYFYTYIVSHNTWYVTSAANTLTNFFLFCHISQLCVIKIVYNQFLKKYLAAFCSWSEIIKSSGEKVYFCWITRRSFLKKKKICHILFRCRESRMHVLIQVDFIDVLIICAMERLV